MSEHGTALAVRNGHAAVAKTEAFIDFRGVPFTQKWQMIEQLCKSDLVPKDFRGKPADVMIVVDIGMSVGMTYSQALQSIACINGRPVIWGDGMKGLVLGSGLCESFEEVEVGEVGKDSYGYRCTAKRRGDPKLITNTFTIRQAKAAGLWDKQGPWKQYPERMLKMRSRSWTCRDGFADVLKGLAMAEEIVDVPPEVRDAIINAPNRTEAVKAALRARTAVATAVVEHRDDVPPPAAIAQAIDDVEAVAPEHVAPTTGQRIEKALDAAAAQDPDFATMKGVEVREFVNGEAAGRNVTEAEMRAIERATPDGKLTRNNAREVVRAIRKIALSRMPDAPTDDVPEAAETPEQTLLEPHETGLVDLKAMDDEALDAYVVDYAREKGFSPQGLTVVLRAFGDDGKVTQGTVERVIGEIDKMAAGR